MYFHGALDGVVAREESMVLTYHLNSEAPRFFFFLLLKFTFLHNLLLSFVAHKEQPCTGNKGSKGCPLQPRRVKASKEFET